jgi:hypothetical protein
MIKRAKKKFVKRCAVVRQTLAVIPLVLTVTCYFCGGGERIDGAISIEKGKKNAKPACLERRES